MRENRHRKKAMGLLAAAAGLALLLLLPACAKEMEPAPTPEPSLSPAELKQDAEKIVLSELTVENRAALRDEDGDFSDWIELENLSAAPVELEGWSLADKDGAGWRFPAVTLGGGERLLVFASGKDRAGAALHTDFSLSAGETLRLYNKNGYLAQSLLCPETEGDVSLCREPDGSYRQSLYPTPGLPNTAAGYDQWQQSLAAAGPLVINEAAVANFSTVLDSRLGTCDWVEIKNISSQSVNLADYYLSDSGQDYHSWRFPERMLAPGELLLVCCDDGDLAADPASVRADFSLNSSAESLYLSGPDYTLIDYVSLRDIPYRCSYGRVSGENGWFFFDSPSPGAENGSGYRRVSAAPTALEPDGVFDGVDAVTVTLQSPGAVYYTTDCSLPTVWSAPYQGPLSLNSTCVLRAVAVEEGAMPSRPLTLSYIINEGHSLPVLSLVSNNEDEFNAIYNNGIKYQETPGNLALYEEGGAFNIPCGIRMYGETSLILPKKNMSVRFRGSYGQAALDYDLYGGGVTEFTNLVLRSGQDFYNTIIRNELCLNLALQFTDNLMSLRSKYCVLYVDGRYSGIYVLMEKSNEQHYASQAGVSRDSVTVLEANVRQDTDLWRDVFLFCMENDLSRPENYERFCQLMDVDSLIDWLVMEGFMGNSDLTSGNLRYCRSTENDGKWRLMFYDLDATFKWDELYYNMFSDFWLDTRQLGLIVRPLLKNDAFVDRFLTRAGEALNTVFTEENIVSEIDRLADQVRPEVERDYSRFGMDPASWERHIQNLKNLFTQQGWRETSVRVLDDLFRLSDAEVEQYFGQ